MGRWRDRLWMDGWCVESSPIAVERLSGFMKLVNRVRSRDLGQGDLGCPLKQVLHPPCCPTFLTPFASKVAVMLVRDAATTFTGHTPGAMLHTTHGHHACQHPSLGHDTHLQERLWTLQGVRELQGLWQKEGWDWHLCPPPLRPPLPQMPPCEGQLLCWPAR